MTRKTFLFSFFLFSITAQAQIQLTFSEINYNSDTTRDAGDWVEFLNYGADSADISGWVFTDSQVNHFFMFPSGTVLSPGERIVLAQDLVKFNAQHPGVSNVLGSFNFGLSGNSELIRIYDNFNNLYLSMVYYDSLPWPKTPDGFGRTLELIDPNDSLNNPENWFAGCMGGSPGTEFMPCTEQIIFSEINYNSDSQNNPGDWVELRNISGQTFDLSGWFFSDRNDTNLFIIPAGTILDPGENLVLVQDLTSFTTIFPSTLNIVGSFNFGLRDFKEVIRLFDSDSLIHTSLAYDSSTPWPDSANGLGYTLEILDENDLLNNADNWFIGCYLGSPAMNYDPDCTVSVVENNTENIFSIFPNPVQKGDKVQFNFQADSFLLFSTEGKIITEKQNTFYFETQNLNKGIYFYQILSSEKKFRGKIVVW